MPRRIVIYALTCAVSSSKFWIFEFICKELIRADLFGDQDECAEFELTRMVCSLNSKSSAVCCAGQSKMPHLEGLNRRQISRNAKKIAGKSNGEKDRMI
jgi:hypothetical protein